MVHSEGGLWDSTWHDAGTLGVDRLSSPVVQKHDDACFAVRIVMKPLLFALCVVFAFGGLSAQQTAWQPSQGHTQVPIWSGTVPDPQPVAGPEVARTTGKEWLVAGRPAVGVRNVSQPTMTVYSPQGKNTGAAVVVFPGGGYQELAIDLEGTEGSRVLC
jgi:hypothetical protein